MNPNTGLQQMAASRIASRAEERRAAEARNATAEWLQAQGAANLASGVMSGAIPATSALGMYQVQVKAAQDPNVQSSSMLRDQSGTIIVMRDGSTKVVTVGGQTLSGKEAEDYVRNANERAAANERSIYAARSEGQQAGKSAGQLPGVEISAQRALGLIDLLRKDPALEEMVGPIQGRLPNVSAAAERFQSRLDQLQGTAFLEAYNMLKGGGAITEIEGIKAERAMARLNTAMNEKDFLEALNEFEDAIRTGVEKLKAQSQVGATSQGAAAPQAGVTPQGGAAPQGGMNNDPLGLFGGGNP